jgi:hypothetical protein
MAWIGYSNGMVLHINSFETEIDSVILDRGKHYWKSGAVDRLVKRPDGSIKAVVYGREIYEVLLKVEDNTVNSYSCSCPYDMGPVCKHVAAVLYELNESPGFVGDSIREVPEVQEIIAAIPEQELKGLLADIVESDDYWCNLILARYAPPDKKGDLKTYYENILKNDLFTIADRSGFIGYRHTGQAANAAYRLLDEAEFNIRDMEYEPALSILQVLLINMYEALRNSDDSKGDIGGCIHSALELMGKLAEQPLSTNTREEFFHFLTDEATLEELADFDWDWNVLHIAVPLVRSEKDEKQLLDAAENRIFEDGGRLKEYNREQRALLELELYKARRSADEVNNYIHSNIRFPAFRNMVLQSCVERKEYARVMSIAREGIKQDEGSAPGLVIQWYEWIVKAARQSGDIKALREAAEKLYFHKHDITYYRILKSTYKEEEWPLKQEEILEHLKGTFHYYNAILIEEELYERLWNNIRSTLTLELLERYEKYVLPQFKTEVTSAYETLIPNSLERQQGRVFYAFIAEILTRLRKAGEGERVEKIVADILKRFNNRPALKDELRKRQLV